MDALFIGICKKGTEKNGDVLILVVMDALFIMLNSILRSLMVMS